MNTEIRLRRILVAVCIVAYAIAAITDVALAFSPGIDATHATAAACVMIVGIGVAFFSRQQEDFMGGLLFKGQSVWLGFAAGLWASVVLAVAGGLYPMFGVGRFISYMGFIGSIAFIPPVLVRGVIFVRDHIRKRSAK